jgi:hypothetical protein
MALGRCLGRPRRWEFPLGASHDAPYLVLIYLHSTNDADAQLDPRLGPAPHLLTNLGIDNGNEKRRCDISNSAFATGRTAQASPPEVEPTRKHDGTQRYALQKI